MLPCLNPVRCLNFLPLVPFGKTDEVAVATKFMIHPLDVTLKHLVAAPEEHVFFAEPEQLQPVIISTDLHSSSYAVMRHIIGHCQDRKPSDDKLSTFILNWEHETPWMFEQQYPCHGKRFKNLKSHGVGCRIGAA